MFKGTSQPSTAGERSRRSRRALAGVAAALVIAASGAVDATTPPDTAGVSAGDGSTPGGVLRFGWGVAPTHLDPHLASSSQDITQLAPTYDRLIHQSPEGDPVPGLSIEWELSADGLTLDLTLREGVLFHDGTPFDAEAVRANIERGQTLEGSAAASDLSLIDTVEVVDPLHARLHLSAPGGALLGVLSDRPGMMISPAAFDTDLDSQPVGTGMYRVVEYVPGAEVRYERFEDYWDPAAALLDEIVIVTQSDPQTRYNAVQSGQLDAAEVTPNEVESAEGAGLSIISGNQLQYLQVQLNRTKSHFDDVRVRQALNIAIDRVAMAESLGNGYYTPVLQPFPDGYWAHDPDTPLDFYPYDPDRARALLAEAGLPDGFEFEAIVPTLPSVVVLAQSVQAYFADVGVTMNLRQVDPAQSTELFFASEESDAAVFGCACRPDPWQTVYQMFSADSFSNPGGHSTPEIEALIAQSAESADVVERAPVFHELSRLIVEEAMDVPVYSFQRVYVHDGTLTGFITYIHGKPEFRGVSLSG
ncbi:MAG: ABC transporter substrate-binding protein [Desertimonas sp.]